MIAADLARAVLLVSIPAAALAGALTMAQLYVVAAAASVFTAFFDAAYPAYLPTHDEIAEKCQLFRSLDGWRGANKRSPRAGEFAVATMAGI